MSATTIARPLAMRLTVFLALLVTFLSISGVQSQQCTVSDTLMSAKPITGAVTSSTYKYYEFSVDDSTCTPASSCHLVAFLEGAGGDDADLWAIEIVDARSDRNIDCFNYESEGAVGSERDGADALVLSNVIHDSTYIFYTQAWSANSSIITTANFTLLVALQQSDVPLYNGVPQYGVLDDSMEKWWHYTIQVPATATRLTVALTARQGSPTMFLSDTGRPTVDTKLNTSTLTSNLLTVTLTDAQKNTLWYIGVYQPSDLAVFYVTASYTTGSSGDGRTLAIGQRMLADGTVAEGRLESGVLADYYYYSMSPNAVDQSLTIDLNVLSFAGEADLYVSTVPFDQQNSAESPRTWTPVPEIGGNPGTYYWKADTYSSDSLTIPYGELNYCMNCNYTIAVVRFPYDTSASGSASTVSYEIIAHTTTTQSLLDAQSVIANVKQDAYRFYRYTPQACQNAVTFTITPLTGTVNVFLSASRNGRSLPVQNNSLWSMNERVGSRSKTIQITDPNACPYVQSGGSLAACAYYIGVLGDGADGADSANIRFTLTATATHNCTNSTDGNSGTGRVVSPPLKGGSSTEIQTVQQDQWIYYQVLLDTPSDPAIKPDLIISMTPISGDPDLYWRYSAESTIMLPSLNLYDGRSDHTGNDTLLISKASAGSYFIGVYGFDTSQFTLIVLTLNYTTLLKDGMPQSNIVSHGSYNFYNFSVLSSYTERLTFTLFSNVGEVDMKVAYQRDLTKSSSSVGDWYSNGDDNNLIVVDSAKRGWYSVAVYGYDPDGSWYTITASTSGDGRNGSLSALLVKQSQTGQISRGVSDYYYFLPLNISAGDLSFTLTTFSSGDCDLYVSTYTDEPGPGTFVAERDWRSVEYGSDEVTIPQATLKVNTRYYVGVSAWSSCAYSLSVTQTATKILQDSLSIGNQYVAKSGHQFYLYNILTSTPYTLIVTATPSVGSIRMYASLNDASLTEDNAQWRSNEWDLTGPQTLQIPSSQTGCRNPATGTQCVYHILVVGQGVAGGNFTIMASANTTNALPLLINNVPATGVLQAGAYQYYQFVNLWNISAVKFTVTPMDEASDPDIYVSTNPNNTRPTRIHCTKLGAASGSDLVSFDFTEMAVWPDSGKFWIGVHAVGNRPSNYRLLASSYNLSTGAYAAPIAINIGQTFTGFVSIVNKYFTNQYFRYEVRDIELDADGHSTQSLILTVTALYGDPNAYVLLTNNTQQLTLPDSHNKQYSSESISGGTIVIPANRVCPNNCNVMIGIQADTNALYSLVLTRTSVTSNTSSIKELVSGQSWRDSVNVDQFKYYYVTVESGDSVAISVTSITGDPDIYVITTEGGNHTTDLPTLNHYDDRSIDQGNDFLTVSLVNKIKPATVFIGVTGYYQSTFSIAATIGAQLLLVAQPQRGSLGSKDTIYYVVNYPATLPSTGRLALSFSIVVLSGFPMVNLYLSPDSYPNSTNAAFKAENANSITLTGAKLNTKYYLLVQAIGAIEYQIIANYAESAVVLTANRFLTDTIATSQYKYYRAFVDNTGEDVSIDITEMDGGVQMIVSVIKSQPVLTDNSTVIIANSGYDSNTRSTHIGIDVSELQSLPVTSSNQILLYIGVYGQTACSYSIAYNTQSTALMLGQPQTGTAKANGGLTYYMIQSVNSSEAVSLTFRGVAADGSEDYLNNTIYRIYSCNTLDDGCSVRVNANNVSSRTDGTAVNGQPYTLPLPQRQSKTARGSYLIGVTSSPRVSFAVTACSGACVVSLISGTTDAGQTVDSALVGRYYWLRSDTVSVSRGMLFIATCQGRGKLATSTTVPQPNRTTGTESSIVNNRAYSDFHFPLAPNNFFGVFKDETELLPFVYDLIFVEDGKSLSAAAYFLWSMDWNPLHTLITTSNNDNGFDVAFYYARPTSANVRVRYTLYWTQETAYNVYSACGCTMIPSSEDRRSGSLYLGDSGYSDGIDTLRTFSVTNLPLGRYQVNVIASPWLLNDIDGDGGFSKVGINMVSSAAKPQMAVDIDPPQPLGNDGYSSGVVAAVAIPVLLFVIALIGYLWYKNRQLKAVINGVEMQEAPTSAVVKAMRGTGFRKRAQQMVHQLPQANRSQSQRYNRLLALSEHEDSRNVHTEFSANDLGLEYDREDSQLEHYSLDSIEEAEYEAQREESTRRHYGERDSNTTLYG